jgi:hypothetical protein
VRQVLRELKALAGDLRSSLTAADLAATSKSLRAAGDGTAAASREAAFPSMRCYSPDRLGKLYLSIIRI